MSRNKSVKQRLDGEQHYDELESDIDEKASERFHTPPAYQSYEVTDFFEENRDKCNRGESNNDKRKQKKWIRIL